MGVRKEGRKEGVKTVMREKVMTGRRTDGMVILTTSSARDGGRRGGDRGGEGLQKPSGCTAAPFKPLPGETRDGRERGREGAARAARNMRADMK